MALQLLLEYSRLFVSIQQQVLRYNYSNSMDAPQPLTRVLQGRANAHMQYLRLKGFDDPLEVRLRHNTLAAQEKLGETFLRMFRRLSVGSSCCGRKICDGNAWSCASTDESLDRTGCHRIGKGSIGNQQAHICEPIRSSMRQLCGFDFDPAIPETESTDGCVGRWLRFQEIGRSRFAKDRDRSNKMLRRPTLAADRYGGTGQCEIQSLVEYLKIGGRDAVQTGANYFFAQAVTPRQTYLEPRAFPGKKCIRRLSEYSMDRLIHLLRDSRPEAPVQRKCRQDERSAAVKAFCDRIAGIVLLIREPAQLANAASSTPGAK